MRIANGLSAAHNTGNTMKTLAAVSPSQRAGTAATYAGTIWIEKRDYGAG